MTMQTGPDAPEDTKIKTEAQLQTQLETERLTAKLKKLAADIAIAEGSPFEPTNADLSRIVRRWQNIDIRDDVVFKTLFVGDESCTRIMLETVLGIKIKELQRIEAEVINQDGLNGRQTSFDLLVTDTEGRAYDVEMQARRTGSRQVLWHRSLRYFSALERRHTQTLDAAKQKRTATYVVFLCDFDPFGNDCLMYCYPWLGPHHESAAETWGYENHIVYLNSRGTCMQETDTDSAGRTDELRKFAEYMRDSRNVSGRLATLIDSKLKRLKALEGKLMTDMMRDEYRKYELAEAKEEGRGEERGILLKLLDILKQANKLDTILSLPDMSKDEINALYRQHGLIPDPTDSE